MTTGDLSQYFRGIGWKRLREVEVDLRTSNQHEINGVNSLCSILGKPATRKTFNARFLYLSDKEDEPLVADGFVTWYDARRDQPHRSAEYRLYFRSSAVMEAARVGDLLVVGKRPDGSVLLIVADARSTIENQLRLLFGIHDEDDKCRVQTQEQTAKIQLGFVAKLILEHIGIELKDEATAYLDTMLSRFEKRFPPTRVFSEFARETLKDCDPFSAPDETIVRWMEQEEMLFRTLERHIVGERLRKGFGDDVDAFVEFSLSVHNRRKSRVGFALENHLEVIFLSHKIRYSRQQVTENKSKPDFLFPGVKEYRDATFTEKLLTVLGVKSTCKDRWRQVLAEAHRIKDKHLFTLEPSISENQTSEMQASRLQLVLPESIHSTFKPAQQKALMNLDEFLDRLKSHQKK